MGVDVTVAKSDSYRYSVLQIQGNLYSRSWRKKSSDITTCRQQRSQFATYYYYLNALSAAHVLTEC